MWHNCSCSRNKMCQPAKVECILLANTMLPELAETLFIQRGEFYGFGTDESEFPVFEQAVHVEEHIICRWNENVVIMTIG